MQRPSSLIALAGIAVLAFSSARAAAQSEPAPIPPLPHGIDAGVKPVDDCDGTTRRWHDLRGLLPHGWQHRRDVCPDCGDHHGIGHGIGHGRLRGAAAGAQHSVSAFMHSGQPLCDPAMQADWIAQQRAATMSWHAGYYHTQYGAPLALVVPPQSRAHTRWSWGVAQSTMMPLYHQFERPYPGPVVGAEYGGVTNPVLPTPRWPSHTDQFGVYYVRGPW